MGKFIGFYDYTVILTYLSLVSSVSGIVLASQGRFTWAVVCLLFSGLCDGSDGTVARSKKNRTEDEKAFGIQIDSLCDVISFGLFPALLCFFMGVNGLVGTVIVCAYCLCAAIRLGFFNVMEGKRQQVEEGAAKYYRGMPVTTISLILPPLYFLSLLIKNPAVFPIVLHVLLALSAVLFVLDVRVKKLNFAKLLQPAKTK